MLDLWYQMVFGPSELNWQSQRVVALHCNKFAWEGFGASAEACKMVDEKFIAFLDAGMKLATGTFPHVVVKDLRVIVYENLKRLSA
jgi:hypothetical protein